MHDSDPDQLVTLLTASSEFAANAIVIVLEDAGIEAFAFGTVQGGLGFMLNSPATWGTPVQVRKEDLEQARAVLDRARQGMTKTDNQRKPRVDKTGVAKTENWKNAKVTRY